MLVTLRAALERVVTRRWYGDPGVLRIFRPLQPLYRRVARRRWRRGRAVAAPSPLPTAVVGNLTVGGSGKTPLVAWLCRALQRAGWRPVILTRGYGGRAPTEPALAQPWSDPARVGDEALELAGGTGVPVVVARQRAEAARWAAELLSGNCLVSDDGLQHATLASDIDLLVVNRQRGFGNGELLPVGPLREPVCRVGDVGAGACLGRPGTAHPSLSAAPSGGWLHGDLLPECLYPLSRAAPGSPCLAVHDAAGAAAAVERLGTRVLALSSIAHPGAFALDLADLGFDVEPLALSDHADPRALYETLSRSGPPVICTEKDAVKLRGSAAAQRCWVLRRCIRWHGDDGNTLLGGRAGRAGQTSAGGSMSNGFHVVIPARFAASRLPGKPLRPLAGEPLVLHVVRQALASGALDVCVATDDSRIADAVRGAGYDAELTSRDHPSGTDRVHEVAERRGWHDDAVVLNVQGDEPLVPPAVIAQVAQALLAEEALPVCTLREPILDSAELNDSGVVKVVADTANRALYFSRAALPFRRDDSDYDALAEQGHYGWRHVGLYGFRLWSLRQFVAWPPAALERQEMLEQLRLLENGVSIAVLPAVEPVPAGVDTPADLARVEALLTAAGD